MHDVRDFVLHWFESNTALSRDELEKSFDADYLHSGWVDSFKFISFIAATEEKFTIHFDNVDFQAPSFATLSGLIRIIIDKVKS